MCYSTRKPLDFGGGAAARVLPPPYLRGALHAHPIRVFHDAVPCVLEDVCHGVYLWGFGIPAWLKIALSKPCANVVLP